MAVNENGAVVGAVSGGCVEEHVIESRRGGPEGRRPTAAPLRDLPDSEAWDVGLPCGGEIDVWVERWET
jgi:xanthine dehydrogenase accessory factor